MSSLFADHNSTAFRYVDVILPLNLTQTLTYGIPQEWQGVLQEGMRVEVALGKNKVYAAVADRLHNYQPEGYQVKPIRSIIDEEPILNNVQLQFWRWVMHYYMAAPGEVMQAALPAHLKLISETKLRWIQTDRVLEWSDEAYLAAEALEIKGALTISELKLIVGQRHITQVIQEFLENEVVEIDEALETTYRPKREKIISFSPAYKDELLLSELFDKLQRAPKQLSILMAFIELSTKNKWVIQQELQERAEATSVQIKALVDKGIFITEERNTDRLVYSGEQPDKGIVFTPAQQEAYTQVQHALTDKNVVLLQGVTGSGKTLLYIEKIRECLAQGKQALLLLPEIALTTQLVSRLFAYFGEEMGVYHSRFSNNERVEIWEKVRSGKYKVVIGPRSALWLPYQSLGIIIADEEHDASYKQKDPAPRFHARDAAIYLAGLHGAKVILGSATPSVETLYHARQGKYGYVTLSERYQGIKMPVIEIINAKSLETVKMPGIKMITPELQAAMLQALQNRRQIILFQNRRGYAPFQMCTTCGWVPHCKNCAVSLTYHKSTDKMHCHYCGQHFAVIHTCPACGSNRLVSKSYGTERIEEEVQSIFPEARIARMDIDSMRGKKNMSQLLDDLAKQKIDILVGTQMVVKGLDFAPIALVGVLSADSLLSYPDFRVNERAFQLMEQVSGRAGRADGAGRVLIQTHNLQHPVLQWVQQHDVNAYYEAEIQYRQSFFYPPFARIIKVIFKHTDEAKAFHAAAALSQALSAIEHIGIQGPVPALVARVRGLYIQEIWIKCPRDTKLLEKVKKMLHEQKSIITSGRGYSGLQVLFDVDPQ
jgi:primosomal protein N' (replication factor Y) (superfamily II helicase)